MRRMMRRRRKPCAPRDPDMQLVKADPLLHNLRGDPRYSSFMRKLNLPE